MVEFNFQPIAESLLCRWYRQKAVVNVAKAVFLAIWATAVKYKNTETKQQLYIAAAAGAAAAAGSSRGEGN